MSFNERFPWEVREDGDTLIRAAAIQNDPDRLDKAQEYITERQNAVNAALGIKPTGVSLRKRNRATVGRLTTPNDGIPILGRI